MDNTATKPLMQLSFFTSAKDTLNEAVAEVFGESFADNGWFIMGSGLPSFCQDDVPQRMTVLRDFGTTKKPNKKEKELLLIKGYLNTYDPSADYYCPECGSLLHGNGDTNYTLSHIPMGGSYTSLIVSRQRLRCSCKECKYNYTFDADFKEDGHLLTKALATYIRDLLSLQLTLKEISLITGVNQNIVKDIDKKRLQEKYTVNGEGEHLLKPEKQAVHIGIDEFKLHDNRRYATVIIDLDTGHVLYLAHTKKKRVVYEFMDFVGDEWMRGVKAVASDMNADYGKAFQEKYPDIKVVYDHFHIVQNLNKKVINEIKKDEVKRLLDEGDEEAAQTLKGSKYVLMSGRDTLLQKDRDARHNKVLSEAGILFNKPEVIQKGGNRKRYKEIIEQNELLFTADLVKEKLKFAYEADTELKMKRRINSIITLCEDTENKHFLWFSKLLRDHYDGIINHAVFKISTGKVEGTNQMIKTLRRKSYGIPDDEYFFLKIMDASRK